MSVQYAYATPAELREIERVLLPQLTLNDDIFGMFPVTEVNAHRLKWRQRDNFQGLQQPRGMGGAFKTVDPLGFQEYDFEPGVYGEKTVIDEAELTTAAELASYTDFVPLTDIVSDRQNFLLSRRLDRIRKNLWDLLGTGQYKVFDRRGTLKHLGTFPLKTVTAGTPWSNHAASTPYADLTGVPLQARGQSVSFGAGAKAYLNRKWLSHLLLNANPADLFGRRVAAGATFNTVGDVNKLLGSQNDTQDIPDIVCYDRGWYSDGTDGLTKGQWYPLIPDGVVIIVGKRENGAALGEYRMTRNANNANSAPGPYTRVRDLREFKSPPEMEVEDSHNGGPVIWFPGAILNLAC